MTALQRNIEEAVATIRSRSLLIPEIGIILGTGLGALANEIEKDVVIPYGEIPHFPLSTVETHEGRLILGHLNGKAIVAMQGRFHYYEGYAMQQITFPVRVMRRLGAEILLVSNVSGGMNPLFSPGDIMLITDHINLLGDNPLIGTNDPELGPRFPDMSEPYSRSLIALAEDIALAEKIKVQKGVYVAVAGPNLETRAEYRFLRAIGADVVGMSTIPEVIVAVHAGMEVLGLSVITDACLPDALEPADINTIIRTAQEAEPKLTRLMKRVVAEVTKNDV
ncbi:MAG: purine-nucleoside phosphorylase [Candidatus Latescibacteria bacterium]|nr:purine-nucleoside phosphorylase [Candidatus Latescibacterota bacterium]